MMIKLIESIEVGGAEEFSAIKNIPNVEVEGGKKLISKITEDLIKLLSKPIICFFCVIHIINN
jgi:hypothetical protein